MDTISSGSFGQNIRTLAQGDKNGTEPFGQKVSDLAHQRNDAKKALNTSILASTIDLGIKSEGGSIALLLKAALENINEALEPTIGPDAIQNTADSGLDVSPEATAERIVSLSTNFFDAFQAQHTNRSLEENLSRFIEVISKGIDQGFSEARDILSSLQVLEGDIASNIDATYALVQDKLAAFEVSFTRNETSTEVSNT